MKTYIIAAGMIVILAFSFVLTTDIDMLIEQKMLLSDAAEDAANAAALFTSAEAFMEGNLVFNDEEGLECVYGILRDRYGLSGLVPSHSFYTSAFSYDVTFYDDTMHRRVYRNGRLVSTGEFTYGTAEKHTDIKGKVRMITDPAVIVEVDAGKPDLAISLAGGIGSLKAVGCYEYNTR